MTLMRITATKQRTVAPTTLQLHPRNVRQGDVGAIAASLEAHGQYRPIVVQESTGYVLAGNHTLKAALALGAEKVAATFIDVDDDEAARIMLVDNRTNDLATYDDSALADLLKELSGIPTGLEGTGYAGDDLDDLLATLGPSDGDERYTPEWIFEGMGVEFDVDLAAPPGGIPHIPAKKYFTKDDDALAQDWRGFFAWCNPPYSIGADFGRKWMDEVTDGVWLGPQTNSTYRVELMKRSGRIWLTDHLGFTRGFDGPEEMIRYPVFLAGFGDGVKALTNLAVSAPDKGVLVEVVDLA